MRFVLDTLKSGSFTVFVKQQSNNDAHGYVLSVHIMLLAIYGSLANVPFVHTGVGFGVARFDGQGDAKASECGTSNK